MKNERKKPTREEMKKKGMQSKVESKYGGTMVLLGVPSTDMVHADFAMSLANVVAVCAVNDIRVGIYNYKGSEIDHSRNMMVEKAKEAKATHLMFIDSDTVIPRFAIKRWLDVMIDTENGKGQSLPPVKILGATLPKRVFPHHQTGKELDGSRIKISMNDNRGITEVKQLGTGLIMFNMEVFKDIEMPYFAPYYKKDNEGKIDLKERVSEDLSLIEKLKDKDYRIYCDIPLSQDSQHIGSSKFDFTSEDFFADAINLRQRRANELLKEAQQPSKNDEEITDNK